MNFYSIHKIYGFAFCLILLFEALFASHLKAQVIYNAYARITSVTSGTMLAVSNVNEASHTFTAGEQVIVMQMQDNVIGANTANASSFGDISSISSAGRYEVAKILAVNRSSGTATSIALTSALVNNYNTGSNSRVQVISFRKLSNAAFTTTTSITGVVWNGSIGGVIALEVGTNLTISHSITADGLGFRSGGVSSNFSSGASCTTIDFVTSSSNSAFKGEGIFAVTSSTQSNGIAKVANGGGGGGQDHNGGGGGGGNFTTGGRGGAGWVGFSSASGCTNTSASPSGLGGVTLSVNISASRVFMGGGGGGGHQNNGVGSIGGIGGGIILLKANSIVTGGCAFSPTISANGKDALNTTGEGNDGAGGGGAGGSIVINAANFSVTGGCPLTIRASGGNGGNVSFGSGSHGGGGAGGQGVVVFSSSQPTNNVTTAANNGIPGCNQSTCGVRAGEAGGSNGGGIITNSSGGVLPIELLYFTAKNQETAVNLDWVTASEKNTNYFLVKRSTDGQTWTVLDKVDASGFSKTTRFYNTIDYNPPKGNVYYLITTVDADQSEQNSPVQLIERTTEDVLMVLYPNPANTNLNVNLSSTEQNTRIELYDITGAQKPVNIVEQLDKKITLDISGLTKGVYFVRCVSNDKSTISKLLINQ